MKVFLSPFGNIYSGDVGDGLQKVMADLNASSVFIVADENTADACVPKLEGIVDAKHMIITSSGEKNKNLDSCKLIWSGLIEGGADRNSVILNVGGGVICDMGGFAASCYQRGIRFGHLPTTLLSMADASIGGKLGVDYEGLKNYIGLIRPSSFIWIDQSFLQTLPKVELISGFAEIVKHAIIGSPLLWALLIKARTIEEIQWESVIDFNIPVKIKIIETDLTEQGLRKVLNFGHTIGHALESFYLTSGQNMTHGQCVAFGMLVESRISYTLGLLKIVDFEAIVALIIRLLKPDFESLPDFDKIRNWIQLDKKKSNNKVGFSLPDGIGACRWDMVVENKIIEESFDWLRAQVNSVPFRLSVDK